MPPPSKSDAPATAAAKSGAMPDAAATGASRGFTAWLPAIAALLLAPAATWVTVEYLLLPRLQMKLAGTGAPATGATAPAASAERSRDGKEIAPGYEFQNVVVNLAGTAGTRYLKTSFLVTGTDANLRATFDAAKPRLTDVTLNVLSSLTLADLEEPGARNVIREKLVVAYNQVLGRKVADQVYFSDFVVQ
jgi:flagellar protein FliL